MRTAHRSALQSLTSMLLLVTVLTLGFSAVTIAYAAGQHNHHASVDARFR